MNKIKKTAVILAGGKSSRMNYKNKAFLKLDGETFIEKIIKKLSSYEEIIIVSNNVDEYKHLGYKVVKDIIPDCGPLSGIHSGLTYASNKNILFVACDMPFISSEFVNYMGNIKDKYEALIPVINGKKQPLCGIYNKGIVSLIEKELLNNKLKLIKFLDKIDVKFIKVDDIINSNDCFSNINTEEEYIQISKKRAGKNMIPIVGIVGSKSNVGKTFVMENIIRELKKRNYKVATIKHDVHGFDMDQPGKDTWKHAKAGADTVIISSAKKMAMIKKVEVELTLEELVKKVTDVDIILVEGYKKSNLPKIEVFNSKICKELYCDKKDLVAVASDVDIKIDGVAVCSKEDAVSLVDIIEQKIIGIY